jgi:hypothetical protein
MMYAGSKAANVSVLGIPTFECTDTSRNLNVGYMFHPGVGYHGDMKPPFWYNMKGSIIAEGGTEMHGITNRMFGKASPEMVVVDSSLWDLSCWGLIFKSISAPRIHQWCENDLPNLLNAVSRIFPESRIVFRTAPEVGKIFNDRFPPGRIQWMRQCVLNKSRASGLLYGKYPVIDYYQIVDELVNQSMPHLASEVPKDQQDNTVWLEDGIHPNKEPARRYFNKVLEMLDIPAVKAKDWAVKRAHLTPMLTNGVNVEEYEAAHPKVTSK